MVNTPENKRPECTYAKLLKNPESTTAQGMRMAAEKNDPIAIRCLECFGTIVDPVINGCDRFHSFTGNYSISSWKDHFGGFIYRNRKTGEKEYREFEQFCEDRINEIEQTRAEVKKIRESLWAA